jgi:hypothetical protein
MFSINLIKFKYSVSPIQPALPPVHPLKSGIGRTYLVTGTDRVQICNIRSRKKGFPVQPINFKIMKFISSLIALALFFAFALVDAAKGVNYSNEIQSLIASQPEPNQVDGLTAVQTPRKEKAGFSF